VTFDPKGKFAYVINELGSTIIAFSYDATKGTLNELQTVSTLPDGFKGNNSTAEIHVHPNGKFLYGSNRGHDSLAVYAIDEKNGTLTFVEHQSTQGKAPRNFTIDPTGHWLLAANMNSDNIVTYSIDEQTGKLTPTGQNIQTGTPVCITFLPIH
jgi:6-phosphogluconolactonase